MLLSNFAGICMVLGLLFFLPLAIVPFYPDERVFVGAFVMPAASLVIGGAGLRWWLHPTEAINLSVPDGMLLAVLTWLMAIGVSVVPLMSVQGMGIAQAIFEATSGWTTSGLTVIDVAEAPRILLFFRSLTQYIGGLGFVLLSVLALASPPDRSILVAEGSNWNFTGGARRTTQIILRIYLGYTVFGIAAYVVVGMSLFDAVNHTFTAVSTGGFSTRVGSIGAFDNLAIEIVSIVLMILGAINFSTAYMLFRGKLRQFLGNAEVRLSAWLLPLCFVLVLLSGTMLIYPTIGEASRHALFMTVSALTGTGYSISELSIWSPAALLILLVLMSIGGGSGSTSGGIKQNRVYVLYLRLRYQVTLLYRGGGDPDMPDPFIATPEVQAGENETRIDEMRGSRVGALLLVYLTLLLIGTFIMTTFGYTMQQALFETSSTLGTVGLSLGVTSSTTPDALLVVQTILMLLGRLEVFAVFIGFAHGIRVLRGSVR